MDNEFSDVNRQILVKGLETVIRFCNQLKMHQVFQTYAYISIAGLNSDPVSIEVSVNPAK
jgi:hypothetical protein